MDISTCSDIMGASNVMQESSIQMLNIDTLLIIFNFLSLYDKLMAMRVCKAWHQIISKPHAWTVIDFRVQEDGPQRKVIESRRQYKRFVSKTGPTVFEYQEYGNPWFLKTDTNVLKFLKQYSGKCLRQLYIGGATTSYGYDETCDYLEKNCPNIQKLDIQIYLRSYKKTWFLSNLQFLKKLKCILRVHCEPISGNSISTDILDQYISHISICSHLRILDITMSELTLAGMKALSEMTNLRELHVNLIITDTFYTAELLTNFESTIGQMFFLRVFKLELTSHEYEFIDVEKILLAIGHWTHLEVLALCMYGAVCEYKCTREAFETMVTGLINLETLELAGHKMVTSSVVVLVTTHLKKLKSLKLRKIRVEDVDTNKVSSVAFEKMISGLLYLETLELDGAFVTSSIVNLIGVHLKKLKSLVLSSKSYSAESLQTLSHHPTLEKLVVKQPLPYQHKCEENWIKKLYSVITTLPKIRKVKMELNMFKFDDIKNMNLVIDSTDIEVESWGQKISSHVIAEEKKWKRKDVK